MRKFAIIGATLAVLGGITAAMSSGSASAAPKSAASSVRVLHLISKQTSLQVVDIGATGASPGDQIIETTVDFQDGKRVDRSVLNCVDITVTPSGFDVLCHGALVFRDGQVEFQGETNFQTPFTLPSPAAPAPTRTSAGNSPSNSRFPTAPPTWRRYGSYSSAPNRSAGQGRV